MISWITKSGIIYEGNEKTMLPDDLYIRFYADGDFDFSILSTNFPDSIIVSEYEHVEGNIYAFKISGELPSILEETTYSICCRLKQDDKINDSVFSINVKTVAVEWDDTIPVPPETIKIPVNTYTIYKLNLINSNGNEIIKKIDGLLPDGITIGNDGSIFGTITDDLLIGDVYKITVTVFVNNVAIARLNKEIDIEVVAADPYDKPTWITETGYIGAVYVNQPSTLRIVATNSTSTQSIFYKLQTGSNLPDGIELTSDGRLEGIVTTSRTQAWEFTAVVFKIVGSEEIDSEPRTFYIVSNPTTEDDEIIWDDEAPIVDLGSCTIGQAFYGRIKAHTKSGMKITYKIIGNTAPVGISLSSDGIFSGKPEYQPVGDYVFTVQAKASVYSSMKTVKLLLKKGLGKYAANLSFAIWNEQRAVYDYLLGHLSKDNRYNPSNPNFLPSKNPIINICTIRSYDKELLPLLLTFAYPEWVRFHKTTYRNVLTIDRYDDTVLDDYDVIYKPFDEAHYQWDELKNGDYKWDEHLPEGDSLTWNDEIYDGNTIELPADNEHPHPINKFNVMNIPNVRTRLTTKVYLSKLEGEQWYFESDQRNATDYVDYKEANIDHVYRYSNANMTSDKHLSFNETCENENTLIVFQDGCYVRPSEYILDENKMGFTFTKAIAVNEKIDVYFTDGLKQGYVVRDSILLNETTNTIELNDICLNKNNLTVFQDRVQLNKNEYEISDDKRHVIFSRNVLANTNIDYILYVDIPDDSYEQLNILTTSTSNTIELDEKCTNPNLMIVFCDRISVSPDRFSLTENGKKIVFDKSLDYGTRVTLCYQRNYLAGVNEIIVDRDGVQDTAIKIDSPYVYKASLNPDLEHVSDFILPYINDIVEEEDGKYYCQLLDLDNEILPYWKRKQPTIWTTNTFYKSGTVLLYSQKYYLALRDFTSTFDFNDNLDAVRKLTPQEVDYYLPATYFPALEIGYYQSGKNQSYINSINALENNGAFWTGSDMVFDEVVVQPYYTDTDIQTNTVTIVYPNIKNYPDGGILEKE